tara:strand:+ start:1535 stop:2221 length:687 start_codon:yes stop_codon:yes gene_type:complete
MKINTALILCAGFGKRLNPITLKTPKPLLKIKNLTLLENCINLVRLLGVKKILINSFYLQEQICKFFKDHNFDVEIEIIDEGENILDTGGGVMNLTYKSDEEHFLIFNPDTVWNRNYVLEINNMIDLYFKKELKNILLLVRKNLSFDKNLNGDFDLKNNLINQNDKEYIYTGCQILNKSIFKNKKINNFSINETWLSLIENKELYGLESKNKFYHVTNLDIFKKLEDL